MYPQTAEKVELNSRGQYAVMAMVELAQAGSNKPLPLSDIADKAGISLSYLEQLIAGLRRHGLVKSYRGPGGGYVLAQDADDITITNILKAAEDSTPAKRATANGGKIETCPYTSALWDHIGQMLALTLNKISLSDIIHKNIQNHEDTSKVFEVLSKSA